LNPDNDGEWARVRPASSFKVTGNEVAGYIANYVKIPDEWSRKQEEQGLVRGLCILSGAVPGLRRRALARS